MEEIIKGVDSSITLFDPEYNVKAIKSKRYSPKQHYFKKGESNTLILDTLREANEPLSTSEITLAIITEKDFDTENMKRSRLATNINNIYCIFKINNLYKEDSINLI